MAKKKTRATAPVKHPTGGKFGPPPTRLYARWHNDTGNPADTFLKIGDTPSELAEQEGAIRVGLYELVGLTTVRNATVVDALIDPPPRESKK